MGHPRKKQHPSSIAHVRSIMLGSALVAATLLFSSSCYADPIITGVSPIYAEQTQTITITGSGFGTWPTAAPLGGPLPYTGNSYFVELLDTSTAPNWSAGYTGDDDVVTLDIDSWSDTSIVLGGFGPAYGSAGWVLTPGDLEQVDVWNAPSGVGPATYDVTVSAVPTPTPEPTSLLLLGTGALTLLGATRRRLFGV